MHAICPEVVSYLFKALTAADKFILLPSAAEFPSASVQFEDVLANLSNTLNSISLHFNDISANVSVSAELVHTLILKCQILFKKRTYFDARPAAVIF